MTFIDQGDEVSSLILILNWSMLMLNDFKYLDRFVFNGELANSKFFLRNLSNPFFAGFLKPNTSARNMPPYTTMWIVSFCEEKLTLFIVNKQIYIDNGYQ